MAHYAFLDDQNIVTEVIVGIDENADNNDYEVFYSNIRGQTCKRTSYNTFKNMHTNGKTPFRGTYAGIGFRYDPDTDKFYPPSPFASWVFNETDYEWEPPIRHPNPDYPATYLWDEDSVSWFLAPSPYASWILNNETKEWEPPIAMPDDGMIYRWDEDSISWELVADPADQ